MEVAFVKGVSAFRAKFWRMLRILGFPTAFITAVEQRSSGAWLSAFGTEFAFVDRAAGAYPALFLRLGLSTLAAKTSVIFRAAGASPAAFRSVLLRLLRRLLYTEPVQILRIDATGLLSHTKAHKAGHRAVFIGSRSHHLSLIHI